jgi:pimeloyl-ACP methyl ester carboxylesterase
MLSTVQANGLSFACLEEGSGPLVLLLHGFPDTAHTWDSTRPALAAAGYRAVSPFMRGYAPTAIPADGDYGVDALAHDVAALIEALGETRAIVIGHDWGASAAFGAAILFPERVSFLVTLAIPHPASLRPSPALLWKVRHFFSLRRRGAARRMRADGFAYVDQLLHRWSPAWSVPPDESSAVKRAFAEPGCVEAAIGYYRALRPRLPASQRGPVRMPAVAFAGATDFAMQPSDFERARRLYKDAYDVVVLPGGHFLHREHPDQFNAELLARLPPAAQVSR